MTNGTWVTFNKCDDKESRKAGLPAIRQVTGVLMAHNANGEAFVREVRYRTFMQAGVQRSRRQVLIHRVYTEWLEEIPAASDAVREIQAALSPIKPLTLLNGRSE